MNIKKTTKNEIRVWKVIEKMGYSPQENQNIIVTYALENLSADVASFFTKQFYVLQICENEIVIVPFENFGLALESKKELVLEISFDSIKNIEITENKFNYNIHIETNEDKIVLSTQQKELSDFRMSGILSSDMLGNTWHKINLDETLDNLKKLGK